MKRELRITEDGSHTLFVPEMEETYHSVHGAIQESLCIFLEQGFLTLDKAFLNILEIGFGTGLNALLTLDEAYKRDIKVRYHSIEKYPLDYEEYSQLNYEKFIDGLTPGSLMKMHESPWEKVLSEALVEAGVLRRAKDGVRLLSDGDAKSKLAFEVAGASKAAIAKVEKAGGSVTVTAPAVVEEPAKS